MSNANKAAAVTLPIQGKNLWVYDPSATTSTYIQVPDSWLTGFVSFQADGADFHLAFNVEDSTPTASPSSAATVSSNAFTGLGADSVWKVADGETVEFDITQAQVHPGENTKLYMAVIASDAAGFLRCLRSSGPVSRS